MMHPDTYLQARRSADHHLQVQIEIVRMPPVFPGQASIEARVGSVFVGDKSLMGRTVEFEVSTLRRRDEMPTDAILWVFAEGLVPGAWLEVFLNGNPPRCNVALWQNDLIAGPTEKPTMSLSQF